MSGRGSEQRLNLKENIVEGSKHQYPKNEHHSLDHAFQAEETERIVMGELSSGECKTSRDKSATASGYIPHEAFSKRP